jgi:hypothetical protein
MLGGTTPYTLSGGTLPNGLTLNASSGAIVGTPTLAGTYTFVVEGATCIIIVAAPSTTSVFVGLGGEYNRYSSPSFAAAILELGVCGSKVCSITTVEMQSHLSTVRSGFGYLIKKAGRVSLFATMDAGATFGVTQASAAAAAQSIALGNLGGGLRIRGDLGGLKIFGHAIPAGFGIVGGVREAAVAGSSIQPEFMGTMSYRWN